MKKQQEQNWTENWTTTEAGVEAEAEASASNWHLTKAQSVGLAKRKRVRMWERPDTNNNVHTLTSRSNQEAKRERNNIGAGNCVNKDENTHRQAAVTATATEWQETRQPRLAATYQSERRTKAKSRGAAAFKVCGALVGVHKLPGQTSKQTQLTSHKMTACQWQIVPNRNGKQMRGRTGQARPKQAARNHSLTHSLTHLLTRPTQLNNCRAFSFSFCFRSPVKYANLAHSC